MESKLTFTKKLAAGLFLTTVTASVIFTTFTIIGRLMSNN